MRTTKPFSTISYNSSDFLRSKLDRLVQTRVISFYSFVEHFAEEEETKAHKHLFIQPNGQVNTDQFTDLLLEIDPQNTLKPLGVMPFQSSKWSDWYLYTTHDVSYLASKGQTRRYHYDKEDYITSDIDFFVELIHTIDRTKYAKTQEFVEQIKNGKTFYDMVSMGQIPAPQFNQWHSMYTFLKQSIQQAEENVKVIMVNENGELVG